VESPRPERDYLSPTGVRGEKKKIGGVGKVPYLETIFVRCRVEKEAIWRTLWVGRDQHGRSEIHHKIKKILSTPEGVGSKGGMGRHFEGF